MGRLSKSFWVVLLVVLAVLAAAGAVWDRTGTAARLRRQFGLSRAEVASEPAIAVALQRRLPLGSDRGAIETFLRQSLDGDDCSMVEFVDRGKGDRGYLCTFGYDVGEFGFVKETYHLWFAIDEQGVLKEVSVAKVLTGL